MFVELIFGPAVVASAEEGSIEEVDRQASAGSAAGPAAVSTAGEGSVDDTTCTAVGADDAVLFPGAPVWAEVRRRKANREARRREATAKLEARRAARAAWHQA